MLRINKGLLGRGGIPPPELNRKKRKNKNMNYYREKELENKQNKKEMSEWISGDQMRDE